MLRRRPHALPARMSPLFLRFLCYSAVGVSVQPVAELRHVQRHDHVRHVYGALRACPTLILHSRAPPSALLASPPLLHALPPPSPHVTLLLPVLHRRARTGCPTRTSSSSVVRGRAVTRLSASTIWSGAIWARARRRHRRRRHCRPTLLMRRHDRRPRRRPTPLRTRPPCGRRSKPTTPTRLPPLRRTAPSPAGASQQSQA